MPALWQSFACGVSPMHVLRLEKRAEWTPTPARSVHAASFAPSTQLPCSPCRSLIGSFARAIGPFATCFAHEDAQIRIIGDVIVDGRDQIAIAFRRIGAARNEAGLLEGAVRPAPPAFFLAAVMVGNG